MAIRDRIAKALNLPAGTVTQTEQQIAASVPQSGMLATPLERDAEYAALPFPPAMPLNPALINQPRSDGRADPRRWEFPVAWNLQIVAQRAIPFSVLREVADGADVIRKCIEVVKAAVGGMNWDIAISDDAIARVMAEQNVGTTLAAKIVREKYQAEITAARDFWKMPDRHNGLTFQEWIMLVLEEVLVIDALSIYPNRSLDNKKLMSLEILDGTTIKPLLDGRGGRPLPPYPAYQQILWGFPRGEFTATADVDGEYSADDLIYAPRTRRTNTPYGFSPVERSLVLADLYMKRLHWFRTEFTDGAVPDLFMETDIQFGNNPALLKQYEQIMNDDLAGNLEQRRRQRMLPNGFHPIFSPISDAKYSSEFDEHLIKQICAHFGVLPSQIGVVPQEGLGGKGHQDGEANTAETIGLRPIVQWINNLLNMLSHQFIGMPADLEFVLSDGTESDEMAQAQRRQLELFSGQRTWNEVRTEMGLPLFTFPEADAPLLVAGAQALPLSAAFEAVAVEPEAQDDSAQMQDEALNEAKAIELSKFIKWSKGALNRDFQFKTLSPEQANILNALANEDIEQARDLAVAMRNEATVRKSGGNPKARRGREPFPKNHPARVMSDKLVNHYKTRISLGSVDTDALATAWLNAPHDNAEAWLAERNLPLMGQAQLNLLKDLYAESMWMGWQSGQAMVDGVRKKLGKAAEGVSMYKADWSGWSAGNPAVAKELLGKYPEGSGLTTMLQQANNGAGILIKNMNGYTVRQIAVQLAKGANEGKSQREIANSLKEILDDPYRREMIAATEMARATSLATIANLKDNNTTMVDWQTSGDEGVCEDCQAMEAGSPYPIDNLVEQAPLHPWCGCQYIPADFADDVFTDENGDTTDPEEVNYPDMETGTAVPDVEVQPADFNDIAPKDLDRYKNLTIKRDTEAKLREQYSNAGFVADIKNSDSWQALTEYQGSGYVPINNGLRELENWNITDKLRATIENIDALLEKAPPTEKDILVRRGVRGEYADVLKTLEVGDGFSDKGFVSTSLKTPFNTRMQLEIVVPKGSQGISMNSYLGNYTIVYREHEMLLPRDSHFEVIEKRYDNDKNISYLRVVLRNDR